MNHNIPLKKMMRRKEQPDVIDKKIVLCLAKNNETLDRDNISERIGNPYQTVKNGLGRLKKQDILEEPPVIKEMGRGSGETKGFVLGYKLKETIDAFIKIVSNDFNDYEFKDFHCSAYCQKMILELAEYLIEKWKCPENVELFDKVGNKTVKMYELLEDNPKISLPKILQISPTSLKIAMLDEPFKTFRGWNDFKAAILASLILDNRFLKNVSGSKYTWFEGRIAIKLAVEPNDKFIDSKESISMEFADDKLVFHDLAIAQKRSEWVNKLEWSFTK